MGKLDGKVAEVTGRGSGIGRATALLFAEEGAKISIFDWNKKSGDETVKMIKERGGEAISLLVDVSKSSQVKCGIKETVKKGIILWRHGNSRDALQCMSNVFGILLR